MTLVSSESSSDPSDSSDSSDEFERWTLDVSSADLARWVFRAYLVLAVPVLLYLGRARWFLGDEWNFLANRSASSLHDLFTPYNQHWTTIPLISYRILYHLVGLHEYWPYMLPVILAHVVIAGLLRVIMRRTGVGPWVATVVAGSYVLFGPGSDDILWAFQIGFALSLVLGLSQMILADHEGPIDRRDWIGLGLGGLALLTSGNAVTVIMATGIAVLWRRGWRHAAFHTVPLGIIYGLWYFTAGHRLEGFSQQLGVNAHTARVGDVAHFAWTSAQGVFRSLGHFPVIAIALVAMVVVGLVMAWQVEPAPNRSRRFGMPAGLAVATTLGVCVTATQRFWLGGAEGAASRYLGVTVALLLPLFALSADALVRRWRVLTPVVLLLFLIPMPWSVAELRPSGLLSAAYYRGVHNYVSALPFYPGFDKLPASIQPNGHSLTGEPGMTVGWLRTAERQGKLPPRAPFQLFSFAVASLGLGVAQLGGRAPAGLTCRTYHGLLLISPEVGDVWHLQDPIQVSLAQHGKASAISAVYPLLGDERLVKITLPNLHLVVSAPVGGSSFRLCT